MFYPHARGEHLGGTPNTLRGYGSFPHTRGTRVVLVLILWIGGLIPAHTGNTSTLPRSRFLVPAHPRPYGEHALRKPAKRPVAGSSPPIRGTPHVQTELKTLNGLIPAHTGNTYQYRHAAESSRAHPRPYGEHAITMLLHAGDEGSSPPIRGTPHVQTELKTLNGLIPAHTGNT